MTQKLVKPINIQAGMRIFSAGLCLLLLTGGSVMAQQASAAASIPASGGSAVANAATGAEAFYDGLGGRPGIERLVARLLEIVLEDPRIGGQFKEIDEAHFKEKLAEQFCQLSGGPCQYSGKPMEVIHEGMHITQAHFNALAEDLQLAMEEQAIAPRIQNKLIARLAPMSRAMIGK